MTYFSIPMPATLPPIGTRRDLDRLFDDAFAGRTTAEWSPRVDIREDAQSFTLELDLPGVPAASVEVLAEDGVLTVKGARIARTPQDGERILGQERPSGAFVRRFRLPKSADAARIGARYVDGVLSVRVEKTAPAQPRRVTVEVAGATPAVTA
jgi:HSP20 family protein